MNTPVTRWVKDKRCIECNTEFSANSYNQKCCGFECYKIRQNRLTREYNRLKPKVSSRDPSLPRMRSFNHGPGIHRRTEWEKDELGNPSRQVGDIGRQT